VDGWISIHRKLLDSAVFDNPELLKMWVWCLLKATHTEHKQLIGLQEENLEIGQFIFGRKVAARELKMSESKVYRFLKSLETRNRIEVKTNNKYSVVTIVNYAYYQDKECNIEQQMNNKRTTNEQQMNTNNKVSKVNNKNTDTYDDFVKALLPLLPSKKVKAVRDKQLPKLIKKYGEDKIIDCVKEFNKDMKDKDKQYIPYESTFWNGRYLDYISDVEVTKKDIPKQTISFDNRL